MSLAAAQADHLLELLGSLDALGNNRDAEASTQIDCGTNDCGTLWLKRDSHEAPVYLHPAERELKEIAQGRVARAEIVHADRHALGPQPMQDDQRLLGILQQQRFCDLKLESGRCEPRCVQSGGDRVEEVTA